MFPGKCWIFSLTLCPALRLASCRECASAFFFKSALICRASNRAGPRRIKRHPRRSRLNKHRPPFRSTGAMADSPTRKRISPAPLGRACATSSTSLRTRGGGQSSCARSAVSVHGGLSCRHAAPGPLAPECLGLAMEVMRGRVHSCCPVGKEMVGCRQCACRAGAPPRLKLGSPSGGRRLSPRHQVDQRRGHGFRAFER
jgi:hypothetical protein